MTRKKDDIGNPTYPRLDGLSEWRRLAASRKLTVEERQAYGQAVHDAWNALLKRERESRKERRERTPKEWRRMYDEAMREKRERASREND